MTAITCRRDRRRRHDRVRPMRFREEAGVSRTSARGARTRRLAVVVTLVLLAGATRVLGVDAATATTSTGADSSAAVPECAGLAQLRIPASVMSLPTNGGRVESASVMTRVVSGLSFVFCLVVFV